MLSLKRFFSTTTFTVIFIVTLASFQNFTPFMLPIVPPAAKENSSLMTCSLPAPAVGGTYFSSNGLVYTKTISTQTGAPQKLDFSRPNGRQLRPLLIYVHGGGWQNGTSAGAGSDTGSRFVSEGYAVANFNYPLVRMDRSGKYIDQFPIPMQALRCGMRYLNKNAQSLGIDTERVVVMGSSAGGNLASMLAYASSDSESLDSSKCEYKSIPMLTVGALITNAGVYRLRLPTAFDNDGAVHYLGDPTCNPESSFDSEGLFIGETPRCRNIRWKKGYWASPFNYISKNSPKTFAVHTIDDQKVNYVQMENLDQILNAKGVAHETVTLPPGSGHAVNFLIPANAAFIDARCRMFKFLKTALDIP